jgi:hypothetical protein
VKRSPVAPAPNGPAYLIHEDVPRYDWSLKLILGGVLAFTIVLGIILLFEDMTGAIAMFGITLFDALLFYFIMPRRYQIYNTKLRIALGGPFGMDIPLSTIKEAHPAPASYTFGYWGIRFATSSRSVMEIRRHKGWNVVISPSDREEFLMRLGEVLKAPRSAAVG